MIRVALPYHLRTLARVEGDVEVNLTGPACVNAVVDALEARFPALRGTIRDPATGLRRPFLRYFVLGEDWSHESPDTALPPAIVEQRETLRIVGAMAGG